ncbi:hypothetical protein K6W16_12080 [Burkholderia dolosa]|jgi:hypothetical protein|uniref:Lipoprotein n=1 Tax=Burkholderia dolosa TaxID=152500 RepID=A0A892IHX7_9BURK|nr:MULTISPECIES: hypothetical protein [Burkholderia]AKE01659.1 hypothetical protein XM57_00840 [Burkholderia cepacia]AJY11229.1 hypothetical protein AK34_5480 [Burkholderia dolosa AU0158]AYZ95925.1 hypothetical protein EGY28_12365 [Burkholderia dolosa]ETP61363.1 hypothetical protein BDSB_26850 [Burkholderia dolosa PC543]MBR8060459.1 hypothetical protein [Burkholderia dolosa]
MKSAYLVFVRRAALAAPLACALAGCMSSTPVWDGRFGDSVRTVMQAQIIDPHAAEHAASQPGIAGSAAASALDNYDKSFKQIEPKANAFVIGIGKTAQ